ncbi:CLUMA_CG007375, isoform A [Clunio marinus]|uniref:CLUMA_CG007375, isoform A n=1 Tax=Clunio marinus TaxID=568069 RepID=A0A1J1I0I4_9DIPT|nr:CLUMA_CG007375, isoform A [Clunio marinus]
MNASNEHYNKLRENFVLPLSLMCQHLQVLTNSRRILHKSSTTSKMNKDFSIKYVTSSEFHYNHNKRTEQFVGFARNEGGNKCLEGCERKCDISKVLCNISFGRTLNKLFLDPHFITKWIELIDSKELLSNIIFLNGCIYGSSFNLKLQESSRRNS